jgi:hypothetical protein
MPDKITPETKQHRTVTECLADNSDKTTTECADIVANNKTVKEPESKVTIELPKIIVEEVIDRLGINLINYRADYQLRMKNEDGCSSYIFNDGPVTTFKDPKPAESIHYFRAYKKVEKDSGETGVQKICTISYDFWGNENLVKKESCEIIKTNADKSTIHFFNIDEIEEKIEIKDPADYSSAIHMLHEINICPPEDAK